MHTRLASLSHELDRSGHPDIADRIDVMLRGAGLGSILTAPLRGLGAVTQGAGWMMRRHPWATMGLAGAGLVGSHYTDHDHPGLDEALGRSWEDLKSVPRRVGDAYRAFSFGLKPGQEIEPPRRPGQGPAMGPGPVGMPTGAEMMGPIAPGYGPGGVPSTPIVAPTPAMAHQVGPPYVSLGPTPPGMDPYDTAIPPGLQVDTHSYGEGVAGVPVGR